MNSMTLPDGALASVRPSGAVPKVVGRHRVLLELGRGGMATVYLAATQGTAGVTKLVVLKTLLHELEMEPEALTMFLDEARLAAQLNHGNIVQTYEVAEEGGRHFIVMEYLDGQSLAQVLRRTDQRGTPLPLAMHLRVLMQILEGLHYTHELRGYDGVPLLPVHRDVSPQNVFVTFDGRAKLLDFGVAKAKTSTTHTAAGLVKGKIAYMCPEQITGAPVDRRADIYSVGCMLWAAAAGRKLWKDAIDVRILHDVVNGQVPLPSSVNPECDPELERIVMKALAKLPDERYRTALELQEELERFCDAKGFQHRSRDCARFLSELFGDFRAEMAARIERELAVTNSGIVKPFLGPTPSPALRVAAPAEEAQTSSTATISTSVLRHPAPQASGAKGRWAWPLVAILTLTLGGYALVSRDKTAVSAASAPHAPSVADRTSAETTGANPPLARGASNASEVPRDAIGELTLEQLPLEQPRTRNVPAAAKPKKPTAKPAAGGSACAQPFFVDADGIKKIKPNCM